MSSLVIKGASEPLILPIVVAALTVILGSPLVLAFYRSIHAAWERKFKYSSFVGIFLDNGQVYFGKIAKLSQNDLRLENVYYLQSNNNPPAAAATETLIKMGNELHAPEDFMLINRDHILFLENLKPAGQVVQAIRQYTKDTLDLNPKK